MKIPAVLIFGIAFLIPHRAYAADEIRNNVMTETNGSGSHTEVKIENNVNTGSRTTVRSQGSTRIEMEQSGDGTSEVNINGRQWKLDGPGRISVNEQPGTANPAPEITIPPAPDPAIAEAPEVPDISPPVDAQKLTDQIRKTIEETFRQLRQIMDSIFH